MLVTCQSKKAQDFRRFPSGKWTTTEISKKEIEISKQLELQKNPRHHWENWFDGIEQELWHAIQVQKIPVLYIRRFIISPLELDYIVRNNRV